MARPGRLELPTLCLEGRRSIQLSYGRVAEHAHSKLSFFKNRKFSTLYVTGRRSNQLNYAPAVRTT